MVGIDRLLSKSLDTVIRENLGARTVNKIESRLVEKYGITLTESIEQFQKLDSVLREFFGSSADGLENKFLKNVCEIKLVNGERQIYIENSSLTKIILESFGDDDKKEILGVINGDALIISEIIEKCDIAQTSGYRKINSLINDGLLVPSGYVSTADGKKVTKYRTIFDNVKIEIIKERVTVSIRLAKEDYESSSVLAVCSQA